jgi:copper chaperone
LQTLLTLSLLGVKSYTVSLDSQTAEITTVDDSLTYAQVLEKISKTGKKVNSGEADGEVKSVEVDA